MSVDRFHKTDVFYKKGVLKKFNKNHKKTPVPVSETCNFIKKETLARCFLVNFAEFLRTPFIQNTSGRLLLNRSKRTGMSLPFSW